MNLTLEIEKRKKQLNRKIKDKDRNEERNKIMWEGMRPR